MQVLLRCLLLFFFFSSFAARSPLKSVYEWKFFDYAWKTPGQKEHFVKAGLYDYRNLTPIDVDRSPDGRTFVTIIRQPGVPASVHTVSKHHGESGPLLYPYPSWGWYDAEKGCKGIISVYRVAIDPCNRIWVLDTGKIGNKFVCPAKLLVFDLSTDELLMKKEIPNHVARGRRGNSLLVNPIVETHGPTCENTTVYIADVTGYALVTWDYLLGFHRQEAEEYSGDPKNANFTIAGESFYLADGLLGMALSPVRHHREERILAFRPLASRSMYGAHAVVLKRGYVGRKIEFFTASNVLPSQASAMAFSSDGTLLYGLTGQTGVGCWHVDRPWTRDAFQIALTDRKRLQFVSGMKIVGDRPSEEHVIMMSNRLQKIYAGTMDFNEINFRVTVASVREVVEGTTCVAGQSRHRDQHQHQHQHDREQHQHQHHNHKHAEEKSSVHHRRDHHRREHQHSHDRRFD